MSDEAKDPTRLLDPGDVTRMHRFVVATLVSAVIITIATTVLMHTAAPDGGWGVAFGVGAMTGFWMSPLAGAVIGNGFHELEHDRLEAAAHESATPTEEHAEAA